MSEGPSRPWEGEPGGGSFGQWLRRQREVREIGLREIAETSKISLRYLEALEQDRFELLPAPVFAKGFLREYSKFVGLDPDEVVNFFLSALPEEQRESEQREAPAQQPVRLVGPLLVVLVVLLAGAAFLSYVANRSRDVAGDRPPIAPPLPQAAPSEGPPTATAPEEPAAPIVLALDFNQNSWVEVYVDGERQVSELRVQGESLRIEAGKEIRLSLGNAAGVSFELNGRPFAPGRIRDREELVVDLTTVAELGTER